MKPQRIISAIFFLFWGITLNAQIDTNITFHPKTTDYSFETGVSFMKFGKNTSGFTKYISPMTNYNVNEKLNLTFGATISQSTFSMKNPVPENDAIGSLDLNSNLLYSGANLRLSDKFSVGGQFFYEYNVIQPTANGEILDDYDSKGMELNLNYHFNEKSQFSFSIDLSEGRNYYDPFHFNNDFFHSGFNNNRMNSVHDPFNSRRNIFE